MLLSGYQSSVAWYRASTLCSAIQRIVRPSKFAIQCRELWVRETQRLPRLNHSGTSDALRTVFVALRPECFSPPRKKKVVGTSWLDGLRGIASFIVVVYHSGQVFYGGRCGAWYKEDPNFFRLPIIRLQCTGTAMVDIFFVVSGYALSHKPLSTIRAGDFHSLSSSLASSIFRRGFRLYLPVAAITFLNAMASYLLIFDPEGRDHVPHQEDFWGTMTFWLDDFVTGINPFHVDRYRSWDMAGLRYEPAMWTIPYEYRGSITVFAILLVLGKTRPLAGFLLLLATVLYVLAAGQWDVFLFLSGTLCSQIHHYMENRKLLPGLEEAVNDTLTSRRMTRTLLNKANAILGLLVILYILTIPDYHFGLGDIPFYPTLASAAPRSWAGLPDTGRFPVCMAAVLLVLYCGHSQFLRNVLSSRLPQYLGEKSFAIYLIHFFLINTLGRPLMRTLYAGKIMLGLNEGLAGATGDWLLLALYAAIAVPVLCWCGEIVTRYVDKKSVDFARWAEKKCFVGNSGM